MEFLSYFVNIFTRVMTFAIFIRVILTWFPVDPSNPMVTMLFQITEPILAPLRRVIPMMGMIDITPMVAIFLLQMIGNMV